MIISLDNEYPSASTRFALHDRGREALKQNCRGSILLLSVVLLSFLSVLLLLVTNSILLGTRARESLRASMEMLYIAEAGLAHGQAFCVAQGEASPLLDGEVEGEEVSEADAEAPFGWWIPFGEGEYRIQAFRLGADAQPFLERDTGILLVATARLAGEGRRRACLLLQDPPSCRSLAWWEPG
jgi:hypothetical protein